MLEQGYLESVSQSKLGVSLSKGTRLYTEPVSELGGGVIHIIVLHVHRMQESRGS